MADRQVRIQLSIDGAQAVDGTLANTRRGVAELAAELLSEARAATRAAQAQAAGSQATRAYAATQADLREVLRSIETPQERLEINQGKINSLYLQGALSTDQYHRAMEHAARGASTMAKESSALSGAANLARDALAGVAVVSSVKWVAGQADTWASLSARLKLATASTGEFNTAQSSLFAIAQDNKVALEETIGLYTKVSGAMREMGMAQTSTLALTEATSLSVRFSGVAGSAASAGIQQFAQAIQSGVLRGDEFN